MTKGRQNPLLPSVLNEMTECDLRKVSANYIWISAVGVSAENLDKTPVLVQQHDNKSFTLQTHC